MTNLVAELRKLHAEITASDGHECEMMALVRRAADELVHCEKYHDQMNEVLKENARLTEKLVEVERLAANNITGCGICTTIIQAIKGAIELRKQP